MSTIGESIEMKRIHSTIVTACALALLTAACASQQPPTPPTLPPPSAPEGQQPDEVDESVDSRNPESPNDETPSTEDDTQEPSAPPSYDSEQTNGTESGSGAAGNRASGLPSAHVPDSDGGVESSDSSAEALVSDPSIGVLPPVSVTADEKTADLDGELDRALEEFDGVLLDEQERLDEQTALQNAGGASGASQGAAEGDGGAGEGRQSGDDGAPAPGGASEGRDDGGMTGGAAGPGDTEDAATESRVPADVGDGSDDDIIARQLREAAMSEEDPDLRERLWEEYRAYKAALGSSSGEDG